jgi:hypothetical protein
MRIDSSGNVGIGTASPSYRLQIDGESATALQIKSSSDTGTSSVFFADPTANTPGFVQYVHTDNAFRFGTNGSERVRIDASGNVGIGIASVSGVANTGPIVSMYGGTLKNTQFILEGDNGAQFVSLLSGQGAGNLPSLFFNNGLRFATATDKSASGYSEAMRIDSSGNLLVGQTTVSLTTAGVALLPTGELYVVRDSGATAYFNREGSDGDVIVIRNDNVTVGSISVSGSTTSYNPSSDVRLKENIRDYDNALADVMKLKPRKYSWKTDGAEDSGFIAQELMETPEFANRVNPIDDDSDDPMYGVDYMKFVAVLTGAIQEQQVMIEELKAEVAALKGA